MVMIKTKLAIVVEPKLFDSLPIDLIVFPVGFPISGLVDFRDELTVGTRSAWLGGESGMGGGGGGRRTAVCLDYRPVVW